MPTGKVPCQDATPKRPAWHPLERAEVLERRPGTAPFSRDVCYLAGSSDVAAPAFARIISMPK